MRQQQRFSHGSVQQSAAPVMMAHHSSMIDRSRAVCYLPHPAPDSARRADSARAKPAAAAGRAAASVPRLARLQHGRRQDILSQRGERRDATDKPAHGPGLLLRRRKWRTRVQPQLDTEHHRSTNSVAFAGVSSPRHGSCATARSCTRRTDGGGHDVAICARLWMAMTATILDSSTAADAMETTI